MKKTERMPHRQVKTQKERKQRTQTEGKKGGEKTKKETHRKKTKKKKCRRKDIKRKNWPQSVNRLNHHLQTNFGIGQTGECPCNMGQQTADHILQTCSTYAAARDNIWPSTTSLEKKRHGSLEDLGATAAFTRETGLDM